MGKERRRAIYATQEPNIPDWSDDVAEIVQNREADFLQRLEIAHKQNKSLGLLAQARIIERVHLEELIRLDPEGRWAVENGDKRPVKGEIDWENL